MKTSQGLILFCALFLISLYFNPLHAANVLFFSGLEVTSSSNPAGARVFLVKEHSPASQSGIQKGDVITSIEGQTVSSVEDFIRISATLKDKESASLRVNRGGKILELTIGKKPDIEQARPHAKTQTEPPLQDQ